MNILFNILLYSIDWIKILYIFRDLDDVVSTILNEIVQSVILLSDSLEKSSIIKKDFLVEAQKNTEPETFHGINESNNRVLECSEEIYMRSTGSIINSECIDEALKDPKEGKRYLSESKKCDTEAIIQKFESSERVSDPTEAIEPYSSECTDSDNNFNKTEYRKKEFGLDKTGVNKGNKPYTVSNNEPSVIVINNYSEENGTLSDSDFDNDTEKSVYKPNSSFPERSRKICKKKKKKKSRSCSEKSKYQQVDVATFSALTDTASSVRVRNDDVDHDSILSDSTDFSDTETTVCRFKGDDGESSIEPYLADSNAIEKTHGNKHSKEKIHIIKLKKSPRIYGRRPRQLMQDDLETPSTSTNIVPSVIVINDYSNGSTTSAYSTGEMQRRTERNFSFLSDSDFSDIETGKCSLGYRNRAYEPSEEIELRNEEAELTTPTETNSLVPELKSISFDNSYIWSTTGLLKVAQVICCITMYISIGLCRFYSGYIQVYCIMGACISGFLLMVYSYRIQIVYWKSFKIRLLLSEFVYLVLYTACDTVFAIIKFEFSEEANYRERMATMILMTSTGIAATTYCYDAISSYSFIKEAEKINPEEKRLILSYLPTCSQSSRAEMCDIFHTCIL